MNRTPRTALAALALTAAGVLLGTTAYAGPITATTHTLQTITATAPAADVPPLADTGVTPERADRLLVFGGLLFGLGGLGLIGTQIALRIGRRR